MCCLVDEVGERLERRVVLIVGCCTSEGVCMVGVCCVWIGRCVEGQAGKSELDVVKQLHLRLSRPLPIVLPLL
jgi:hypothetical protein